MMIFEIAFGFVAGHFLLVFIQRAFHALAMLLGFTIFGIYLFPGFREFLMAVILTLLAVWFVIHWWRLVLSPYKRRRPTVRMEPRLGR